MLASNAAFQRVKRTADQGRDSDVRHVSVEGKGRGRLWTSAERPPSHAHQTHPLGPGRSHFQLSRPYKHMQLALDWSQRTRLLTPSSCVTYPEERWSCQLFQGGIDAGLESQMLVFLQSLSGLEQAVLQGSTPWRSLCCLVSTCYHSTPP